MVVIPRVVYMTLVHEAEEGGYWGEVTNLPGCVSQGETLEELEANILEAIEAVTDASGGDVSVSLTHGDDDRPHPQLLTVGPDSSGTPGTVTS